MSQRRTMRMVFMILGAARAGERRPCAPLFHQLLAIRGTSRSPLQRIDLAAKLRDLVTRGSLRRWRSVSQPGGSDEQPRQRVGRGERQRGEGLERQGGLRPLLHLQIELESPREIAPEKLRQRDVAQSNQLDEEWDRQEPR